MISSLILDCWAPPEFKASYERYAETLCFVNGTYYISATEIDIPTDPNHRYSNKVRYYQWTPFILLLQALCMYMPRVIWLSLNTRYGINLRNLVDAAKKYESVDSCSNKQKILVYLCKNLLRTIQYNQHIKNKNYKFSNEKYMNSAKKASYVENRLELNKMIHMMTTEDKSQANVLTLDTREKSKSRNINSFRSVTHKRLKSSMIKTRSGDDLNANNQDLPLYSKLDEEDSVNNLKTGKSASKKVNFKANSDHDDYELDNSDPSGLYKKGSLIKSSSSSLSNCNHDKHKIKLSKSTRSDSNSNNFLIIKTKLKLDSKRNEDEDEYNDCNNNNLRTPLNIIKSGIKNISKKHLLNSFSAGYEANDDSNCSNFNYSTSNYKIKSNKSNIYLVNNRYLRDLLKLNANKEANNKENEANKNQKTKSKCSFNVSLPNLSNNYLSNLYLFVKLFYLLSSIGQLFFLNRLIGNKYYMIGVHLILSFLYEIEWPNLSIFPRMTICEIYIREIGTIHPYLIQCVLRINLFNEVIFILVWFWLVFVIGITSIDLLCRFVYSLIGCSNCQRKLFALKYLELIHMNTIAKANNNQKDKLNINTNKNNNPNDLDSNINSININDLIRDHSNYIYLNVEKQKSLLKMINKSKSNKKFNKTNSVANESYSKPKELYYDSTDLVNKPGYSVISDSEDDNSERFEYKSINNQINLNNKNVLIIASKEEEFELFEKFCEINFNNDTIFALKVIQQNASSLIVSEIIEHLWIQFKFINLVFSNDMDDYLLKKIVILNDESEKELISDNQKKRNFNQEKIAFYDESNKKSPEEPAYHNESVKLRKLKIHQI